MWKCLNKVKWYSWATDVELFSKSELICIKPAKLRLDIFYIGYQRFLFFMICFLLKLYLIVIPFPLSLTLFFYFLFFYVSVLGYFVKHYVLKVDFVHLKPIRYLEYNWLVTGVQEKFLSCRDKRQWLEATVAGQSKAAHHLKRNTLCTLGVKRPFSVSYVCIYLHTFRKSY